MGNAFCPLQAVNKAALFTAWRGFHFEDYSESPHLEWFVLHLPFFSLNAGSGSEIQFLSEAQDDPQKRKPDIRKAKMMLAWEPVVSAGPRAAPSTKAHNRSLQALACLGGQDAGFSPACSVASRFVCLIL